MIECCGLERTGRFCDQCGKKLNDDWALESLLQHCIRTRDSLRKRFDDYNAEIDGMDLCESGVIRVAKSRERYQKKIKKWESWVEKLSELISK